MKSHGLVLILTIITTAPSFAEPQKNGPVQSETRCGWFDNPAPGNISLYDRDGEWIIGVQGGYQTPEGWQWPTFNSKQWVKTNVHYGYGCACLEVRADSQTHNILAIGKTFSKPLKSCQQDQALIKWKKKFK